MKKLLVALLLLLSVPAWAQDSQNTVWAPLRSQRLINVSPSSSTAISVTFGEFVRYARVLATTDVYLAFNVSGGTEPATAATGLYLPGLASEIFKVSPGGHIRVMAVSATSAIHVTDLSQ